MSDRRDAEIASVQRMVGDGARPQFVVRTLGTLSQVEIVVTSLPWLHPVTVTAAGVMDVAGAAIAADLGIPLDSFDLVAA